MFDSYRDLFLKSHVQPVRFALYYLVMQCCFAKTMERQWPQLLPLFSQQKQKKKSINNWSTNKPLVWKSIGIMTTFSVCRVQTKNKIFQTCKPHHDTTKFTPEIPNFEFIFLDTKVCHGERFKKESTFDMQTNYKETEIFQYPKFLDKS